ncbi:RsmB/NOP family class I SAM-dependent RNA methyltransferase [Candidatus Magnetaquicoccus inordinatus]|uniref:RsmB/NOP family class I SAM-dependent RNA methyltransferase n=1 Tax=Candidatus Magnetaquicoccus inordinatus TaxID=2496818 RepID=UPI00102AA525|nr:RsmB/NOP family class I SAM-dependent RNA methyltransferase [Candidatus Magnetaquicoccus inordinatus]
MADPLIQEASQLLQAILPDLADAEDASLRLPAADQIVEQHFRQQHSGSLARTTIANLVYQVLRHRRFLQAMLQTLLPAGTTANAVQLVQAASIALHEGWQELSGWQRLAYLLGNIDPPSHIPQPSLSMAEQLSLPDWLWQNWSAQWGVEEACALGLALNQPATLDLRVNTLQTNRAQLTSTLQERGLATQWTEHAPQGVRLQQRLPLHTLPSFQQGWFEVQDEGSQLMAPLLQPKPGELLVDLCAGGGGKTLHLAALMHNRGRIIAVDNEAARLQRLTQRSKRAGVRIIRTVAVRHERDKPLKEWENKADAVLVDVPCSGSGTLRRHPEIKWRLHSAQVEAYHYRQCALLEAGSRLLRPGGRLLYVTCSLLARENQEVIAAFLADNRSFRSMPLTLPTSIACTGAMVYLLPQKTGTDGFFAALLQRSS